MVPPSLAPGLLSGDITTELWSTTGGLDAGMHGQSFEAAAKKPGPKSPVPCPKSPIPCPKSPIPCPVSPMPCSDNPSKKTKR